MVLVTLIKPIARVINKLAAAPRLVSESQLKQGRILESNEMHLSLHRISGKVSRSVYAVFDKVSSSTFRKSVADL